MPFLSEEQISKMNFKSVGKNIKISDKASFYNAQSISIGSNVRIDDFCLLSASDKPFTLEDYIHISAGVYIFGSAGFHMKSFSNISSGTKIYTASDTFDGSCLIGPTVPFNLRKVKEECLVLEKHTWIGPNSIILPGITIGEGCAIGALSFVKKSCNPWSIYGGNPLKYIKERDRFCLEIEKSLLS